MPRNILYKLGLILAVAAFSLFLAYPPGEKINLGLDLRGGIHLVLEVVVDEAVAGEARADYSQLLELLEADGIRPSASGLEGDAGFTLTFNTELDRDRAEGVSVEYFPVYAVDVTDVPPSLTWDMPEAERALIRENSVRQALQTIRNRIDQFGVAEPVIQRQGMSGNRILVQLPGVEDPERVKNLLRTSAILQWRLVHAGPADSRESLVAALAERCRRTPKSSSPSPSPSAASTTPAPSTLST
jgi:preprotein translocase subunit SecD